MRTYIIFKLQVTEEQGLHNQYTNNEKAFPILHVRSQTFSYIEVLSVKYDLMDYL